MADFLANLPLTRLPPKGHCGATAGGIRIRVLDRLSLASFSVARHGMNAVVEASRTHFGVMLVDRPRVSDGDGVSFLGMGPGRWLAVGSATGSLVSGLTQAFGERAAVCDQSDAYTVIALDGASILACLAKGPAIDFDPTVFKPGDVATTSMGHIGLTIWATGDANAYRIAIPCSFAPSFLRMLLASAAEFGIDFS